MNRFDFLTAAVSLLFAFNSGLPASEGSRWDRNTGGEAIRVYLDDQLGSESPSALDDEEKEYDVDLIKAAQKKASFEFYNALMYRDPESWKGQIVCLTGEFPGTAGRSREYMRTEKEFYLQGEYNNHPIAVIVKLDHSLPVTIAYGKAVPRISPRQEIYVFGRLSGLENIMNEAGYSRALPVMQCLLIYDRDDRNFLRPLWVSSAYERPPEGTVTTDSLKYEFDRPKKR